MDAGNRLSSFTRDLYAIYIRSNGTEIISSIGKRHKEKNNTATIDNDNV
jgi:hypothetical protein